MLTLRTLNPKMDIWGCAACYYHQNTGPTDRCTYVNALIKKLYYCPLSKEDV